GAAISTPHPPRTRREARLAAESTPSASADDTEDVPTWPFAADEDSAPSASTATTEAAGESSTSLREAYDAMIERDGKPLTTAGSGHGAGGRSGGGKKDRKGPRKPRRWPWIVATIVLLLLALAAVAG